MRDDPYRCHGQGGLGSILIGSVSREVARHSGLPVMIVKMPEEQDSLEDTGEDEVLI